MSDRRPNPIARFIAVVGVIVMFAAVIAVIATSAGGGDDGDSGGSGTTTTQVSNDPDIQKAIQKGEYRVKAGDTLTAISEATGIDIDTLIELNPETDPQALIEGRKIKLR